MVLPGPQMSTNPLHLADWVELKALASADLNASHGDLVAILTSLAPTDETPSSTEDEQAAVEDLATQAFDEMFGRQAAAGDAYPFTVENGVLRAKQDYRRRLPYLYCLMLSFFGYERTKKELKACARLFEELARDAAVNYVQGSGIRFGWPRTDIPRGFRKAVDYLCTEIGEGKESRPLDLPGAKDGSLDIVVWRDFPDRLPGRIMLFGQCACGNDWKDKTTELRADGFGPKYMLEPIATWIVPAFFIPHRFEGARWKSITIDAGIVFDRCRVASYAGLDKERPDQAKWVDRMLNEISAAG